MTDDQIVLYNAISTFCLLGAAFALGRCLAILITLLTQEQKKK